MSDFIEDKYSSRVCEKGTKSCNVQHNPSDCSESALNDLLSAASRHYAEMPPHVRKRKTAGLLKDLIQQNKQLQEALKPFAQFACSERNSCTCNNCIARDLLDT